ncbi:MAG: hypothetical protein V4819_07150 [Verrucomicrobiota bacterium]
MKFLSYALVAGIGGTAGWMVKSQEAHSLAPVAPDQAGKPTARSHGLGGGELLESFVQKQKDNQKAPNTPGKGSLGDRFNELNKSLPVSADPAADFRKLLAEFSARQASGEPGLSPGPGMDQIATLAVVLGRWMDLDAKAAFAFIGKGYATAGGARIVSNAFMDTLATRFIEKHGLPALIEALAGTENLVNSMADVVFGGLGKRGSLQELELLKGKAPEFFSDYQAGRYLGKEWPVERRDELLAALDPKSAAYAMPGIMERMSGSSGGEWILAKLKSGEFPREIKDAMASSLMGAFNGDVKGATLEQRLEIMRELGTLEGMGANRTKNEMIYASLRNCFNSNGNNDDFLFGLRHGALTASEVVELAKDKTVDPGVHRAEYNSQMFRTLAEENLPAALELLAGMDAAAQEKEKAFAARWWFRDTNPNEFYQITESVVEADDGMKSMMQDSWNDKASANLSRFGSSYLEWIKSLPDGENKTRALKSVQASGGKYPKLALEAGNLLKHTP